MCFPSSARTGSVRREPINGAIGVRGTRCSSPWPFCPPARQTRRLTRPDPGRSPCAEPASARIGRRCMSTRRAVQARRPKQSRSRSVEAALRPRAAWPWNAQDRSTTRYLISWGFAVASQAQPAPSIRSLAPALNPHAKNWPMAGLAPCYCPPIVVGLSRTLVVRLTGCALGREGGRNGSPAVVRCLCPGGVVGF